MLSSDFIHIFDVPDLDGSTWKVSLFWSRRLACRHRPTMKKLMIAPEPNNKVFRRLLQPSASLRAQSSLTQDRDHLLVPVTFECPDLRT